MKERVVVTGMGAITPIGNSVNDFWQGIKENKIGFAKVTHFDASEYKAVSYTHLTLPTKA